MTTRRPEVLELQDTLKHVIAARRLTLHDMAAALDVSIATAKRLLNGDDLSLERVLQICDWLGIRFHEVVEMATRRRTEYHYCTPAQEDFLAAHPAHLAFLRALQKGDTLARIEARFSVSGSDCAAYLADLETAGFVEQSDAGEPRLLIKDGMDWRPDGPLWRTFFGRWVREFAEHMAARAGDADGCVIEISQRKLSRKAYEDMRQELDELSRKYASISRLERELHGADALEDCSSMLIADLWMAPLWTVKPYGSTR
jgi:transcriptional regulator with XRE-family HTH domain